MRFRTFQIARLLGIPVIIDFSWIPVVLLHIWLASAIYLPRQTGHVFSLTEYYLFGTLMSALLFSSIVAHELAHAVAARLEGVRIYDIQLHIFGGWTRLASEPPTPLGEFRIAVAGPTASFVVGLAFFLCLAVVEWLPAFSYRVIFERVFVYLFIGNLVLAMFNLLPGLPLDGGRALRAWLWHRTGDVMAATRTAKRMGTAIAYMLSSFGIFSAFWWGDYLTAVWLVIVGFFLRNVAEGDYRHRQSVAQANASADVESSWRIPGTVGEIMSMPPIGVAPETSIDDFIEQTLSEHRHTTFPVVKGGRLHGILSLSRVRPVPQSEWSRVAVRDVMEPVSEAQFIPVRSSISHAKHKLNGGSLKHLAVVDADGVVVGYLSARDLVRAKEVKA
jgi:Zn-dependent protease